MISKKLSVQIIKPEFIYFILNFVLVNIKLQVQIQDMLHSVSYNGKRELINYETTVKHRYVMR